MSKGSRNRTADMAQYGSNFDVIFGKQGKSTWGDGSPDVWGAEDERRKALDAADLDAIVRPKEVERVCGNCKHWVKPYCDNDKIMDMINTVVWSGFETPADFGCNKFEA